MARISSQLSIRSQACLSSHACWAYISEMDDNNTLAESRFETDVEFGRGRSRDALWEREPQGVPSACDSEKINDRMLERESAAKIGGLVEEEDNDEAVWMEKRKEEGLPMSND